MTVHLRKVEEIRPYENNARLNDDTVKALKKAIRRYGFNQPIVIDENGVIVKGHARYAAAVALGMPEIPCVVSENTEDVNRADRLADNRIHELTKWDDEGLRAEMRDIDDAVNEVLGERFNDAEYGNGPAFTDVTPEDMAKAAKTAGDRIAKKPVMLRYTCPECGEIMYLRKEAVRGLP